MWPFNLEGAAVCRQRELGFFILRMPSAGEPGRLGELTPSDLKKRILRSVQWVILLNFPSLLLSKLVLEGIFSAIYKGNIIKSYLLNLFLPCCVKMMLSLNDFCHTVFKVYIHSSWLISHVVHKHAHILKNF